MTTTRQTITFNSDPDIPGGPIKHDGHEVVFLEMHHNPLTSLLRPVEVMCFRCFDTFIAFSDELFITVKEN